MAKQTIAQRAKLKKAKPKPLTAQFVVEAWEDGYAAGYDETVGGYSAGYEAGRRATPPSLWSRIKGWFK